MFNAEYSLWSVYEEQRQVGGRVVDTHCLKIEYLSFWGDVYRLQPINCLKIRWFCFVRRIGSG